MEETYEIDWQQLTLLLTKRWKRLKWNYSGKITKKKKDSSFVREETFPQIGKKECVYLIHTVY